MAKFILRAIFVSVVVAAFVSVAHADVRTSQNLVPTRSKIRFGLQGNPLNFSGGFRTYSGRLERGKSIADSVISFAVDLSKVKLDPAFGGLDIVSFEPLFQKIPHPVGKFNSTSIALQGGNRFQVVGNWERGGKTEEVRFPIVVVTSTSRETRLETRVVQRFEKWDASIPIPVSPNGAEGSVSGELVFQAAPHK